MNEYYLIKYSFIEILYFFSFGFFFSDESLLGGWPYKRVICHCCRIDKALFTKEYNTSPAGKKKKNTLKAIGMNCKTLAWIGSVGLGFSLNWINIDIPINTGIT